MKKSHKRSILMSELERGTTSMEIKQIVDVLNWAVSAFNGKFPLSDDWREHLKKYIQMYCNDCKWDSVEYGFSGDHFWLHDAPGTKGKRILFIYLLNVVVPH